MRLNFEAEVPAVESGGVHRVDVEFHTHIIAGGGHVGTVEILTQVLDTAGDLVYRLVFGGVVFVKFVGGVVVDEIFTGVGRFGKFASGKGKADDKYHRHTNYNLTYRTSCFHINLRRVQGRARPIYFI